MFICRHLRGAVTLAGLLLVVASAYAQVPIVTLAMGTDTEFIPTYTVSEPYILADVAITIILENTSSGDVDFWLEDVTSWDGKCMNYGADNGTAPDIKLWKGDQLAVAGITWEQVTPGVKIHGTIDPQEFTSGDTFTLRVDLSPVNRSTSQANIG